MYNQFSNLQNLMLIRSVRRIVAKLPTTRAWRGRSGFGLNEVIGIAITVTVAALVVAPGIKTFAGTVLTSMNTWFTSISSKLFLIS